MSDPARSAGEAGPTVSEARSGTDATGGTDAADRAPADHVRPAGGEPHPGPDARPSSWAAIESELKYRVSQIAVAERLLHGDVLAGFRAAGPARVVRHVDRYVDTPDGAIARAGFAARLREDDAGAVISLKALRREDAGGTLHRRGELEGRAGSGLDARDWPPTPARSLILELAGDEPLTERVRLRQVRHRREYELDGTLVELSADDVEVVDAGRVLDRFAELELELRGGEDAALELLASFLSEIEELVPADTSKLERALEALGRRAPSAGDVAPVRDETPADARPDTPRDTAEAGLTSLGGEEPSPEADGPRRAPRFPGVRADDHLAEAGRKVLRFHVGRMVAREPGTRAGRDLEELHAMRVATRRQRAAWRVFGEAFDPARTRRHRRRLREVARRLGAVRDLDVLIEAAEAYRDRQPEAEAAAFRPLIDRWQADRETARTLLLRELDGARYRTWLDDYLAFLSSEGAGALPVGPTQPHRVRDTMPSRIWAAYEQVRAYEPVMRWADVDTLHELRIAAKWLRYTLEFVREALGREAGPIIERVVALQDQLGWLHDADVSAGLARTFLVERAGDLTEAQSAAIGRYLVDRERELARLRRSMDPAWRGVARLSYRRALGRLVAGL